MFFIASNTLSQMNDRFCSEVGHTIKKSILVRTFRGELGMDDPTEENVAKPLKMILYGFVGVSF